MSTMPQKGSTTMTYEMSVQLPCSVRLEKETMTYVSECPPLNILSAGETEEQAIKAIESAVIMYLQSAVEDGLIGQFLSSKGFRFTANETEIKEAEQVVAVRINEEGAKPIRITVPIGLLAASSAAT